VSKPASHARRASETHVARPTAAAKIAFIVGPSIEPSDQMNFVQKLLHRTETPAEDGSKTRLAGLHPRRPPCHGGSLFDPRPAVAGRHAARLRCGARAHVRVARRVRRTHGINPGVVGRRSAALVGHIVHGRLASADAVRAGGGGDCAAGAAFGRCATFRLTVKQDKRRSAGVVAELG